MGQFQSREYDGDPYIELMRAVPERELIWWIQKVVWLVEGATFLEHFGRTYPDLFVQRCPTCNGAGCMTCPHCGGGKDRLAAARAQLGRLGSPQAASAAALALAEKGSQECQHCGPYCNWDEESEWQEKWNTWESKLAYYDRAYGELVDEWYEDVIHQGQLDEDTPHEEPEIPADGGDELAAAFQEVKRYPKRMAALMARFGGHPYEKGDMLRFNVVDPQKSLRTNMAAMGYHEHELPPELHPMAFPELLITPFSDLQAFDEQVTAEYHLMINLDAALRNKPKPTMLQPSAGTVPCPGCAGTPYAYTLVPNVAAMFRLEPPFWQQVLARSAAMGRRSLNSTSSGSRGDLAGYDGPGSSSSSSRGVRHYLEYPQVTPEQDAAAGALAASLAGSAASVAARGGAERALARGASRAAVGYPADGGEQQQQQQQQWQQQPGGRMYQSGRQPPEPDWWEDTGSRVLASRSGVGAVGSGMEGDLLALRGQLARSHPVLGDRDPLSDDWAKAADSEEVLQAAYRSSPLDGKSALERGWPARSAMPGKQLAQQMRDARMLQQVEGEQRDELVQYLQRRRPASKQTAADAAAAGNVAATSAVGSGRGVAATERS